MNLAYIYGITFSLEIEFLQKFKFSFFEKTIISLMFFIGFGVKIPI